MLTREQILAAPDLKSEAVEVPEWGGTVCVRVMTGAERVEFEKRAAADKDRVVPLTVAMTACDADGALLFDEKGVDELQAKSVKALYRVYEAAVRLNALTPDAVDGAEKNSSAIPSGSTPSGSPPG